jgi:hypothetical protein
MVEKPDVDRGQGLFDLASNDPVGTGRFRVAGGVVVEGDDRSGIQHERSFDDLARVDFRAVHRAEEEIFDREDGMANVEEDAAEDFAITVSAVGAEKSSGACRFDELALAFEFVSQDAFGGFEDLFVLVAPIQPHVVGLHGVVSRGGSASWSRPSAPSARFRIHERARDSAQRGPQRKPRCARGKHHHGKQRDGMQ